MAEDDRLVKARQKQAQLTRAIHSGVAVHPAREHVEIVKEKTNEPKKKSFFRRLVDFDVYDGSFEREWGKLGISRLKARRKLILNKKTITHTEASVTVENANSPRPRITFRAQVRQVDIYTSSEAYGPDEISRRLRERLPQEVDEDELERPIGDMADDMSAAELRMLMERSSTRRNEQKRVQSEKLRQRLEHSTTSQLVKSEEKTRRQGREAVSHKRQGGAVSTVQTKQKTKIQQRDDPSQLEYYQRLGVIGREQSKKVLEQQRERLNKARENRRSGVQTFAEVISAMGPKPRPFDERRLSSISEGKDLALVPKGVIQNMQSEAPASAQTLSRVSKPSPVRTNPFFRSREKSALVAKISQISLEVGLTGDTAGAFIDSGVIGAIAPDAQTITFASSSVTVSEQTIVIDPDDPVPSRNQPTAYKYLPLANASHLRLLAVEPFVERHFLYEIKTFPVNEAPPFESVSYVWGRSERDRLLSFRDSRVLKITRSLYSALPLLSQHCRTGYLWIDQLCIDQSNMDERNHQVKSMGAIYRQADKVLVFLDSVRQVIQPEELFTMLGFVERSLSAATTPASILKLHTALAEVIKPHYDEGSDHAARWRDIVRLFQHSWFTRAWIFQELALSDIVLFAMGERLAPLDAILHLATAAARMEGGSLLEFRPNECLTKSPGLQQLQLMATVREERMRCGSIDPDHFWDIFSQVAPNCKLSDERDRLYAFLGLFTDPRVDIQPDYRTSIADVFVQAASAVFQGQESLDLLRFVDRAAGKRSNLPSWVPDWRRPQNVKPFNQKVFAAAYSRPHIPASLWHISPAMGYGMRVRGRIIDQITYIAPSSFYSNRSWESRDICSFLNLDEHVVRLMRQYGKTLGAPTQILERLLRTILADGAESSVMMEGAGHGSIHPAKLKRLVQTYQRSGRVADLSRKSKQPVLAQPSPTLLRQLRQLSNIAFGRRIIATKKSRLGLGPDEAAVGDYVCILHGSSLPVVFSRQTHVKGQCYLEGVMRGETVTWRVNGADVFWLV